MKINSLLAALLSLFVGVAGFWMGRRQSHSAATVTASATGGGFITGKGGKLPALPTITPKAAVEQNAAGSDDKK